jgi:recombinational DNA repair protein RecR
MSARDVAARAFERTHRGRLWSDLPTDLQDTLAEIVEAAIEIELDDERPCAECGHFTERVVCEECWLQAGRL